MADLHARLLAEIARYEGAMGTRYLTDALRAAVELHEPTHFLRRPLARPICETCSTDDDMHDERWPCSTIRVIAEQLGVEIEDKSITEKEERHG